MRVSIATSNVCRRHTHSGGSNHSTENDLKLCQFLSGVFVVVLVKAAQLPVLRKPVRGTLGPPRRLLLFVVCHHFFLKTSSSCSHADLKTHNPCAPASWVPGFQVPLCLFICFDFVDVQQLPGHLSCPHHTLINLFESWARHACLSVKTLASFVGSPSPGGLN